MSEVKIPEGYKQTEIGVIPEDWEISSIDDYSVKVGSGKTPTGGSSVYVRSGRPFIRSQNVGWGKLKLDDVVYITEEIHDTFLGSQIEESDVLLNITGASIGRCSKADNRITGGNVNQHVCLIRTDEKKLISKLLVNLINSNSGQKQIDSYQAGGNREGLNFSQVRQLRFAIPTIVKEQTAIATALSDVDNLIQSLEKLTAKKEAIKTGTMQQLLTGKTRLPEFATREDGSKKGFKQTELGRIPEDWEVVEFGKLLKEFRNGYSFSAKGYIKNGTPIITMSQIGLNGSFQYNLNEVKKWDASQFEYLKDFWVKDGDLLIAMTDVTPDKNLIGQMTIAELTHTALLNQRVGLLRLNKDLAHSNYLRYLSSLPLWRTYCKGVASLGVQANIGTKEIKKAFIALPSTEEQTVIATILSDMDAEIQALQQRLDKTKDIKQGMMQQLLTGKVRLAH